ncbi:MAG: NAD-dependent epimerase/dehydratase family protein [Alphaproteobacteria bacterium]|nr:NAD-dependent epimerase/dehydratase family protein [Alphaproteobacteria bacterium]
MADDLVLVLGATGGVGGAIADALHARGWRVRAMGRDVKTAAMRHPRFSWVEGDALNRADVISAAHGAKVIVHGVNPPRYRNWAGTVVPMIENTIAAARREKARIVFPGTLYNYGLEAFPIVAEDDPQRPHTRKGALRVAMERKLEEAARSGASTALIVRAGDYFGPGKITNSWFTEIVKPNKRVSAITYPGLHDVGHAWAYLPDLGETVAALLAREPELAAFERFHFAGHSFERGIAFAEHIRTVLDRNVPIRPLPWLALRALAPFAETLRETLEMRYLWTNTLLLDNRKLTRFLGREPHTPIAEALRVTLAAQGSLM